jgi:prepilin-type N-terminal cleavage/methylation domain-containing protein
MNQRGFTLVELLIYMTILVIILGAIANITAALSKQYVFAWDKIKTTEDHRYILSQISDQMRMATRITSGTDNSKINFEIDSTAYEIALDSTNKSIVFKTGDVVTNTIGAGNIENIAFLVSTPAGTSKRQITIDIKVKNISETLTTNVITFNNISN